MSQPEINIRILDLNGPRMAQTERSLRRHLKQHAVEARITLTGIHRMSTLFYIPKP